MSSYYPSNGYSNPPAYPTVRPNYAPNYGPQAGSSAISGPYMPTTQYRQQQPGPSLPYGSNGTSPSQPGRPQRLPDRTTQSYSPIGQYRQDINTSPDSTYAPVMTRGSSSESHSSSEGLKEQVAFLQRLSSESYRLTSFQETLDLHVPWLPQQWASNLVHPERRFESASGASYASSRALPLSCAGMYSRW